MPWVVVAIGIPLIIARGSVPSLAWDDGPVFWNGAAGGLATVVEPYGGYFHPFARTVMLVGRSLDAWWPGWLASLVVALYVASYLASDWMESVLPHGWQRLAAGVAVLVLPGTVQTLGLLAQAQWYGALFMLAWLISGGASPIALAFFAILGPFSLLLSPLILLLRPAGWRIVLVGGVVQLFGLFVSARSSAFEPGGLLEVLVFRGVLGPMLGQFSTVGMPPGLALALTAVVATLSVMAILADRTLWPVFAGGAIIGFLGMLMAGETNEMLLAGSGARYFLGLGLGFALYAIRSPRSPVAWAVAALMLYAARHNFPIPFRGFGWG